MKHIALFGSTGSIGQQTLEVAQALGYPVIALSGNKNDRLLEQQARKFRPRLVVAADETAYTNLKVRLRDTDILVLGGEDGLEQMACLPEADTVVTAIVGMAGLAPTLHAIKAGKDIALANKETLVCAGSLVMPLCKQYGVRMLPVDSEHSAIFQCLCTAAGKTVKKVILTASGGPFFGRTKPELAQVRPQDALKHPNWDMGAKITIDSATMMNKGLEFIEAMWLYDLRPEQVDIVIHRESIIHSLVEFCDSSVLAQLGYPDMRLPIQYALTHPVRVDSGLFTPLDLAAIGSLSFASPDLDTFSCLRHAIFAAKRGGNAGAVLNGANEQAVDLFLQEKISFLEIGELVCAALETVDFMQEPDLAAVQQSDAYARRIVRQRAGVSSSEE